MNSNKNNKIKQKNDELSIEKNFNQNIIQKRDKIFIEKANARWIVWKCLTDSWLDSYNVLYVKMSSDMMIIRGLCDDHRKLSEWMPVCPYKSFDISKINGNHVDLEIRY